MWSSIFSSLEVWLVNHTSIYENSELSAFKNIIFFEELSNKWPKDLLEINVYKTLQSCW